MEEFEAELRMVEDDEEEKEIEEKPIMKKEKIIVRWVAVVWTEENEEAVIYDQ